MTKERHREEDAMSAAKAIVYGSAALFAAGAVGWELSRRRAAAEMERAQEPGRDDAYISEEDVWRGVSEDVEPTLLDNPDGLIEFQEERAERLDVPAPAAE
jgi:hypothetical protein